MATNKNEDEIINPTLNFQNATQNPVDPTANYNKATQNGFTNPVFSVTGLGAQKDSLGQKYIGMNYTDWTQGNDYASLSKRYSDKGRQAMDDTIGQMAARTGGLASSYAATAGQQAYGSWMEKLEDAARSLYDSQKAEALNAYNVAAGDYDRQRGVYESDRSFEYGKYRDGVDDAKWADGMEYGAYRDGVSDAKWQDEQETGQFNTDREYNDNQIAAGSENVKSTIKNGGKLDWATWSQTVIGQKAIAAGYTEAQFKADVTDATNQKNNGNKATNDNEIRQRVTGKGFLWGDWDGDGKVGTDDSDGEKDANGKDLTFADVFGDSTYSEEYWKSVYEAAQNGYNEVDAEKYETNIYSKFYNMDPTELEKVTWEEYKTEFEAVGLDELDFERIKNDAKNKKSSETKTVKDTEYMQIFGNPNFLWGDWDGDGTVEGDGEGKTFDEAYGGSSYGEKYWEGIYNDAVNKRETEFINNSTAEGISETLALNGTLTGIEIEAFDKHYGDGAYYKIINFTKGPHFQAYLSDSYKNLSDEEKQTLATNIINLIEDSVSNQKQIGAIHNLLQSRYSSMWGILEEYLSEE